MASKPVVLCGQTEQIGQGVVAGLKPEYDVIHFVLTPEAGSSQIPLLLRGEATVISDSTLGSKDYSRPPIAVITGGGYDDDGVAAMMKACEGDRSIRRVPWLRPDLTKPAPPLGPLYGQAMVARVKETLQRLQDDGEMNTQKVIWF